MAAMLSGNWLLAERFLTTILYKLLRLLFISIQQIYWQLNGTTRRLREARLPHNYEWSAQVLDVVMFHQFCSSPMTTVDNFLCTHNRFEHPRYIIDNENITLLTINEQDAIFCETRDKDMRVWRGEHGAFIRHVQRQFCQHLIVVPLSTFHRLAELIGDPSGQLIFLCHTTRCGSTLLNQIMEQTGRCVSISEPCSPCIVATKYRKYGDSPELRRLARDVIRWECRPYRTMQPLPLGYFVKLIAPCVVALPLFRALYPSSRFLFMYRDVLTVAKSNYRLTMVLPSLRLATILGYFSGQITKIIVDSMGHDGSDYRMRLDHELTGGVLLYALTTGSYLDLRRRGFDISAVRYEDLVARPLDMCRLILDFCHFPTSLAELAVKAFDVDSQRNSILAKSVLQQFRQPQLTPQIKTKLDEMLKKQGLPLIGEPGIVEGTLSFLKVLAQNIDLYPQWRKSAVECRL